MVTVVSLPFFLVEVTVRETVVVFAAPRITCLWVGHLGVGRVFVTDLVDGYVPVNVRVVWEVDTVFVIVTVPVAVTVTVDRLLRVSLLHL